MYNIVGMCQIYNESSRCDNINLDFFENILLFYSSICDHIVFLDDCSTDNTVERVTKFYLDKYKVTILKNERNAWQNIEEVKNKIKLHNKAKEFNPDIIVSFDFDEFFPSYFTRKYLETLINYLKNNNLKALKFQWTNFWLSEGYYRTDRLGQISPPRIWIHDSSDEIIFEKGLHRFLWPLSINDKNTLVTDIPLLHYSFINYEILFDKLLYYKNMWNDTVEKMMPLFTIDPVLCKTKDLWFGKKIERFGLEDEIRRIKLIHSEILLGLK